MIYLIKIIILLISFSAASEDKNNNKIYFKLNDEVYTRVDIENRLNYIEIINNKKLINLNPVEKKEIIDDFISSLIFNEYKKKYKLNYTNINSEVEEFYIKTNNNLEKNNVVNFKFNIKIDLIRKKIIEDFLNSRKDILKTDSNYLDLIYNYNVKYIYINKNNIKLDLLDDIKNRKDFLNFKDYLEKNKLSFLYKNEDIMVLELISDKLKNQIINDKKIYKDTEKNFQVIVSIEKSLESYEGLFVKLVNIKVKNKIENNELTCKDILKLNNKVQYSEYEYSKLNNKIKNNLKSVNDYILINNDNEYNYIFLCELNYDEKVFNLINFNKKVKNLAQKIEIEILNKYKKEFRLQMNL